MIERECTLCGEKKQLSKENFRYYRDGGRSVYRARCLVCERLRARHRDRTAEYQARAKKRAEAKAARLRDDFECRQSRLSEQNAHQAWLYWIESKAPSAWVERYFYLYGKPHMNPRLSRSERARIRYKVKWDSSERFRVSERQRQQVYKIENPDVAARYGDKRKRIAQERSDGTLSNGGSWKVMNENDTCPYCGIPLSEGNKALDHMDPLSKGGGHSVSNLTVCCRECNSKKSDKHFVEWLACIPEKQAKISERLYRTKQGRPPSQYCLEFYFGSPLAASYRG